MASAEILKGVIHGKTIELDERPDLPDGQSVAVVLHPVATPATSPNDAEALEALRRAAGSWASDSAELDEFLKWNREQRQHSRSEIGE